MWSFQVVLDRPIERLQEWSDSIPGSAADSEDLDAGTSWLNLVMWPNNPKLGARTTLMITVNVNVVELYSASTQSVSKALTSQYSTHCRGITQFYQHTLHFIRKWNELYLPLSSQPQLVLIHRLRRDWRLSRPLYKVAQVEIWTCNLLIANLALCHTAISALILSKTDVVATNIRDEVVPLDW